MATMEQMQTQIEQLVNQVTNLTQQLSAQAARSAAGPGERDPRELHTKGMKPLMFAVDENKFDDFVWPLKLHLGAQCPKTYAIMNKIENDDDMVDEMELDEFMMKRSRQLFNILSQVMEGEPFTMIKPHMADGSGFLSYQTIFKKYNPKTRSRMIRLLRETTRPVVVHELRDIEKAALKWEDKLKQMKISYSHTFHDDMKIGIFTGMLPLAAQDYISTSLETAKS